jgi:hypothetical protein
VTSTDPNGSETAPNPMTFNVTRTGSTSASLAVNITWTGTASAADYTITVAGGSLSGSVLTIAAGSSSATVTVTPVNDTLVEGSETVILTVASGGTYTVGSPSNQTGTIADNDGPLMASAGAPTGRASASTLTLVQLRTVVERAKAAWLKILPSADFTGLSVSIGDLDGLQIGLADGRAITLDATAAGWGWSTGGRSALPQRMNLFTAVMHEIGHVLGFEHSDARRAGLTFMAETLAPSSALAAPAARRLAPSAPVILPVPHVVPVELQRAGGQTTTSAVDTAVGFAPGLERSPTRADPVFRAPAGPELAAVLRAAMASLLLLLLVRGLVPVLTPRPAVAVRRPQR